MTRYRYTVPRSIWCRFREHFKDVRVCDAAPYFECRGCAQRRDDREKYRGRTHRVVDSTSRPGEAFVGEVYEIEEDETQERRGRHVKGKR